MTKTTTGYRIIVTNRGEKPFVAASVRTLTAARKLALSYETPRRAVTIEGHGRTIYYSIDPQ